MIFVILTKLSADSVFFFLPSPVSVLQMASVNIDGSEQNSRVLIRLSLLALLYFSVWCSGDAANWRNLIRALSQLICRIFQFMIKIRSLLKLLKLRLQLRWSNIYYICISAVHIIFILCFIPVTG